MSLPVSAQPGCIVLAAYRPDPTLFRIQLESIRDQTRTDWRCLIGADSGQDEVRRLVGETVGDDPRFEVIGWDDNVGFYLNFERLLSAVPDGVGWVALSDQDDRWYPDKLERLVPSLDDAVLAAGRFRVVTGDASVTPRPTRHSLTLRGLLAQNALPGATMVFRRELLATALPFPGHAGVTAAHDHWLAVCAAAVDRCVLSPAVGQDYVQHGGNAIGFEGDGGRWPALRRRAAWVAQRLGSPSGLTAEAHALSFGWREAMATTLLSRMGPGWVGAGAARPFARGHRVGVLRTVLASAARGDVGVGTLATFVVGLPGRSEPPAAPTVPVAAEGPTTARGGAHVRHRRDQP